LAGKLVLGTFNAEKYWREDGLACLPELYDAGAAKIVRAMDELLFPLCERGDVLLTRFKMDPAFKDYLNRLGFQFVSNNFNLEEITAAAAGPGGGCIEELLNRKRRDPRLLEFLGPVSSLHPYAVLPGTTETVKNFGWEECHPPYEAVKKVNSKEYSNELNERIGVKKYGKIIHSTDEYHETAARIGNGRGFIIKDLYGVSGKGNLLVAGPSLQKRIGKHLAAQEEKGLAVRFLMEPYFDKVYDFSCQLYIGRTGDSRIVSIQEIKNYLFTYIGSLSAGDDFICFLKDRGYFELMQKVAEELYGDGYCGDVCIDSMILKNDELVPVVEINARKSMGLINYYIDRFLAGYSARGYFVFFTAVCEGRTGFHDILEKLEHEGILFTAARGRGVLPLSANALFVNQDEEKSYKGRFYFSAAAGTQHERQGLVDRTVNAFTSMGFRVYYR